MTDELVDNPFYPNFYIAVEESKSNKSGLPFNGSNILFLEYLLKSYNISFNIYDNFVQTDRNIDTADKILTNIHNGKYTKITITAQTNNFAKDQGINLMTKLVLIADYVYDGNYESTAGILNEKIAELLETLKRSIFNADKSEIKKEYDKISLAIKSTKLKMPPPEEYEDIAKLINLKYEEFLLVEGTAENNKLYFETGNPFVENIDGNDFDEIESSLELAKFSFRHDLKSLKKLSRANLDKFVLPLDGREKEQRQKFQELSKQPFSFLEYNGSRFVPSIFMTQNQFIDFSGIADPFSYPYYFDRVGEQNKIFTDVKTDMRRKLEYYRSQLTKLHDVKIETTLEKDRMKEQFLEIARKFKNSNYINFAGSRAVENIEKMNKAINILDHKIDILRKKRLRVNPAGFAKRAIRLYFGKTGSDIVEDITTLGLKQTLYVNEFLLNSAHMFLRLIDQNKDSNWMYKTPALVILDNEVLFKNGGNVYGSVFRHIGCNSETVRNILQIFAGHLFFRTVVVTDEDTITKKFMNLSKQESELELNHEKNPELFI